MAAASFVRPKGVVRVAHSVSADAWPAAYRSQAAFHAALCALTCRMVSAVSFCDHVTGSKALHATVVTSGPLEPVVVVQAVASSITTGNATSALYITLYLICLYPLLV